VESIRVIVPDEVARKLRELAERDYRAPRGQAAVLLIDAVERAAARKPARGPQAQGATPAEPER
jgi:hypothetical protein